MIFNRKLIKDGAKFEGKSIPKIGFLESISLVWCGRCVRGMKIPEGNSFTTPMVVHYLKSIGWVHITKSHGWVCPKCVKKNNLEDDTA